MENRKRKGFTLIELMVVIVIIGILGTIVVTNFVGEDDKARVKAATASLRTIYNAVQRYQMSVGEYPETLTDLVNGPADFEGTWNSLIVGGENALKDPWGNDYDLQEDDNGNIVIVCYGKDGAEGIDKNEEFDKDLYYPDNSTDE